MRVGRNELCPCGSGKKYKNCCATKDAHASSRGMIGLLSVIAVIAAVGIFAAVSRRGTKPAPRPTAGGGAASAPATTTPRPQPPGPVPPGKVWSPEHGHWHDAAPGGSAGAAPTTIPVQQQPANRAPVPQPPGTPPPGKVWSPEHGHWHDAPK
jgi:SEC-C motif